MFISIIIPAYNEESLIGATLDAINAAIASCKDQMTGHEVLVVNDASTDRTAEISRQHGARVIDVQKRQIAAVRNAGAKAANGDAFVFVDADTLISPIVLHRALAALHEGAVGGGAAVRFDQNVSYVARTAMSLLVSAMCQCRLAAGCFIYCRRDAFETVGGFDEQFFASEEIWISKALNRQGRFVMLRHPVTTSGRKIRMHGLVRLLWLSMCIGIKGPRGVQQREGLDLWYDGRRE